MLARATYEGRPGHPVLLGRAHWDGVIEAATGDQGARGYLAGRDDVEPVECGDLATGLDVDEVTSADQRTWNVLVTRDPAYQGLLTKTILMWCVPDRRPLNLITLRPPLSQVRLIIRLPS